VSKRSNEEWITDLRGDGRDQALNDLRSTLTRGLTFAMASKSNVDEAAIEDFVQDALLKILDKLDTFRGESQFTTWAQKIAVHVAFTELRRRRWQDISLDGMVEAHEGDWIPTSLTDPSAGPEQQAARSMLAETLGRLINKELTEKQRTAMMAIVIQGMPLEEVARRMDSNRNALYKLLHDARKRLKSKLEAEGLTPQEVMTTFG